MHITTMDILHICIYCPYDMTVICYCNRISFFSVWVFLCMIVLQVASQVEIEGPHKALMPIDNHIELYYAQLQDYYITFHRQSTLLLISFRSFSHKCHTLNIQISSTLKARNDTKSVPLFQCLHPSSEFIIFRLVHTIQVYINDAVFLDYADEHTLIQLLSIHDSSLIRIDLKYHCNTAYCCIIPKQVM